MVVAFGSRWWRATTDLTFLLDLQDLPEAERAALTAVMPQFQFAPRDFVDKTPSQVRAMGLSLLGLWTVAAQQFVAPVGKDNEAAIRAIAEWADVARRVLAAPTGQAAIEALSSYFLKVTKIGQRRLHVVFDTHLGPESVKQRAATTASPARAKPKVRLKG